MKNRKSCGRSGHIFEKHTGRLMQGGYRKADAGRIQEEEYERYVELWAHEVKIPLSLFTLLLENRSEEMSPTVHKKMEHVRLQMQSYVCLLYTSRCV